MHYKQLHYTAGSIAAELECNKDPSSQSSRERARTSLIATSSFVWILVPASTSGRYRTISSSLINEKKAQPPKKKISSEHEPRLLTEVDLSEGAAPDLAAEPELVPDPGLHYSSPFLPKTDRRKRRKKLLKKRALFAAEI